ncbi:MAG: hypothetical protein NT141_02640 [candidate division WWE3 bacterium]|nr:hypothetical protein [candidate division WWE3 bacterium]
MKADAKRVLFISKDISPQIKIISGLRGVVGGVGLAAKLSFDYKSLCLAIGPLSGAYPGASSVAAVQDGHYQAFNSDLALNMCVKGIDAVVALDIPCEETMRLVEEYLKTLPEEKSELGDGVAYEEIYNKLFERVTSVWKTASEGADSCAACPLNCANFRQTKNNIDLSSILGVCLGVASVYVDLAIAFAALQALGFDYTHEELEEAVLKARSIIN